MYAKKCMKITCLVWPSIQNHSPNILPSNLQLGKWGSLQWLLSELSGFSYCPCGNTWNSLDLVSVGHPFHLQTHSITAPTKTQLPRLWREHMFFKFPTVPHCSDAEVGASVTLQHYPVSQQRGKTPRDSLIASIRMMVIKGISVV